MKLKAENGMCILDGATSSSSEEPEVTKQTRIKLRAVVQRAAMNGTVKLLRVAGAVHTSSIIYTGLFLRR